MTGLLLSRYVTPEPRPPGPLMSSYDELLDRPVVLLWLDQPDDRLRGDQLVRRLRRLSTEGDPHVCPVLDAGREGEQPFVVLPGGSNLAAVLPVPLDRAVRAVLDVVAGVRALRRRGLAPFSLLAEQLRVTEDGTVQVLPSWGGPAYLDVLGAGELLARLLGDADDPEVAWLRSLADRARHRADPPLTDLDALVVELGDPGHGRGASAPATGRPPPPEPRANPGPSLEPGAARADAPVVSTPEPPARPPGRPPASGPLYVPLSALLDDQDDGRPGPR